MSFEIKHRTKQNIAMVVCIVLCAICAAAAVFLDMTENSNLSGICAALIYALCLILIKTNGRRGVIASMIIMGLSLLNIIRIAFMSYMYIPYAGLINTILYIVTIAWLAYIFAKQEKEAVTDVVTGLKNRRGLNNDLQAVIESNKPFYLITLEINNFKALNENYGHVYGDRLLRKITKRMVKFIGAKGMVSRMGGAEFAIIIKNTDGAEKIVNDLMINLRDRFVVALDNDYLDCYLTTYAGMAKFPEDTRDYETLINFADMAMGEAIHNNSSVAVKFVPEMENALHRQIELEHIIKEGLENNYFYLVYQPQYVLDGKKLRGFETLIRLRMPNGSMVSPAEFIPVAEKSDYILEIDNYVLHRAMRECRDIVSRLNTELTISINVSAKNIGTLDFPERIQAILDETEFPAKNLEIEITEYCMVQSINITVENIMQLRKMGIQVALDDFGTGYTSLNYLSQMPVNLLKIDKSLIDDIETNQQRCEFVNAIISMGHLMGCEVISEGVENETQLEKLGVNKCDLIQGYVWGKPLAYDVAKNLSSIK